MSKKSYFGVNGVARNVKSWPVGIGNVARKAKSGYFGVGGVARQFLSGADPVLNNNDWATIRAVSDAGQGANYWSVGDTKTITINGKVGYTTFSNLSIDAFIIGFNHNSAREGANRIHFKIGKISGVHIALCDSNYGRSGSSASYFQMNASSTNSGGNSTIMGSRGNNDQRQGRGSLHRRWQNHTGEKERGFAGEKENNRGKRRDADRIHTP